MKTIKSTFWKYLQFFRGFFKTLWNCDFSQNFHTRKLSEVTVFYVVYNKIKRTLVYDLDNNPSSNNYEQRDNENHKLLSKVLKQMRQKDLNRPIIGQLNMNSIRNKFQFLADQINYNLDMLISKSKQCNFYQMDFRNFLDKTVAQIGEVYSLRKR